MADITIVDEHCPSPAEYAGIAPEFPDSNVRCYSDYEKAFDACESNPPDLLVVNGDVWKFDVLAHIRRLRARVGWKKLSIVLIGSRPAKLAEDARINGADAFIEKPGRTKSLLGFLHKVLRLRKVRTAARSSSAPARVPTKV
jgi:DNA-binding response OmpR family regulator